MMKIILERKKLKPNSSYVDETCVGFGL